LAMAPTLVEVPLPEPQPAAAAAAATRATVPATRMVKRLDDRVENISTHEM
jgi:hypothetical protein